MARRWLPLEEIPIRHGKQLYRQRHKVEIMFGRLQDWRRIAPATTDAPNLMSAIALAASVLFWLPRNESRAQYSAYRSDKTC